MEFEKELARKIEQTDGIVKRFLPAEEGYQKRVMEAANYSVMAGGKRLRPLLMAEMAALFAGEAGVKRDMLEPYMAAIEMIHTYSLVHDDLPAMDNDRYRRGKLTTHAAYGEAMGILAGDALLNYAFETAAKAFDAAENVTEYKRAAAAIQILGREAGIYGMIGGQTIDIEETGCELALDRLQTIYRLKTGALLKASMQIGACLAGADEEALAVVGECALTAGMAFQIQDDILDVTSTQEELGKPIHSDEKNRKTTYVTLFGIDGAGEKAKETAEHALALYDSLGRENEFLRALLFWLVTRKK
ncbi:MAG: polyprenyl synthetase family protein [Lachnospiraceae bacterium]|nr:polyprenyl synthetase family protein [Lachnospiraceae bacterium]